MTSTDPATGVVTTANASGLRAVERELTAMHRALLRAGGEEARSVRLSVVTLVVACTDDAEAERAASVVAAIAAEHPARAILVVARPDRPEGIEAELRLECSVSGGADQVCAEVVRLRVGGDPALHLASVMTPLLLPDVPVHLWLAGAPRLDQALAPDALALVERVVVDTDAYADTAATLRALAGAARREDPRTPIADLAWMRLQPWRELVARAFDAASRRPLLAGVDAVEVTGTAPSSTRLVAGWIASRLGLDPARVTVRAQAGAEGLEAVRIRTARPVEATVDVRRDAGGLHTEVVVDGEEVARRSVPLDPPSLADLVGAALQEGGADPVYTQALAAAAEIGG